jgi:hypothetical protein
MLHGEQCLDAALVIQENCGGCRLRLRDDAWGDGATLQEAADDLVARVMRHALALRSGGVACPRELCPPDARWLEFLYKVGEIAARGGDVRQHIVGIREDLGEAEAA